MRAEGFAKQSITNLHTHFRVVIHCKLLPFGDDDDSVRILTSSECVGGRSEALEIGHPWIDIKNSESLIGLDMFKKGGWTMKLWRGGRNRKMVNYCRVAGSPVRSFCI